MATATLPQLLEALQKSVTSVADATPKLSALTPPEDGLSLLDVKNELLLSYLEHMIFLILLKLRGASSKSDDAAAELSLSNSDLGQSVVKKLVELRLYLEKGVRPLEEKLRYQVEKALRAAEEVERTAKQKADAAEAAAKNSDDESGSGSDSDDSGSDARGNDNEDEKEMFGNEEESAASRPNRGAFVRPSSSTAAAEAAKARAGSGAGEGSSGGVYRPPKIAPTMMPTTERRERAARRAPMKSATMDEFIADELSSAPMAELSVGANIAGRGRHMTTASERQREDDRREYEEKNFVRLPKASKKDRAKQAAERGGNQMSFGGEEWRGLGEGVDRINRLTQRKSGGGGAGGARSMLDKSRKRGIDTIDGPRGSGAGAGHEDNMVGGRFNKKLRLHQVGRRDRGKK
ncbi:hypothetical protein SBRCBS47491_001094 [Sporothrix bragantina]|uniref:Uncharacterized protein n=1 Tax=Sporothrix bragantina TaxID=671064 RepID=A0ABP0AVP0_9PEZI